VNRPASLPPRAPDAASASRPFGHPGAAAAIRVMVVDDSLTVRTIFKRMVESDPALVVAGTASSAERAIAQLGDTPADVVLLDLEMPGIGGLDALPAILATPGRPQVLVVSSLTVDGAEHTMSALQMGAADTLLKPRPGGFNEDYRAALLGKIRALGSRAASVPVETESARPAAEPSFVRPGLARRTRRPEVIAIGASTGGIHALGLFLRRLGPDCDVPLVITQHLPASFMPVFARQIEAACGRPAEIAGDGLLLTPGRIIIAPGHGHVVVKRKASGGLMTRISSEPQASGCIPSVDPMLASLAEACEGRALGVILSGMGRDGVMGAQALVDSGGTIFAQDADTSAVWGMPGAVSRAGLASLVAAPERLGDAVMALLGAPAAVPVAAHK
jgi:two-component system, chemotaxis family, protein-glutamate methylesterase/glutaminase